MAEDYPNVDGFEGPKELREAYERAVKENKALRNSMEAQGLELKNSRIASAGFQEGSPGFTFLKDFYDGDSSSVESIREFAERYGYKPGDPAPTPAPKGDRDATTKGDERLGELHERALPPEPPASTEQELEAAIAKAEQEGNLREAISLKNQLFAMRRSSIPIS